MRDRLPPCAGWFFEISRDFDKSVDIFADVAVESNNRMSILPLHNLDRKGRVMVVMR